ncbi:oxidoreductase [Ornithinimicrobium tianjinense]|uniref:Oxidoreductase n=1 Tax=Ornithinimicrobium tianjinense TaxID=1195761 RepID=A0A917BEA5_9MICO|nr:oxidoreductase [Ornithinimicrobium tianjinense]
MAAVTSDPAHAALGRLLALTGVEEAVGAAREACTALRWHEALRRRIPEAAAESRVRGAAASAMLEGAEPAGSQGSVPLVRELVRGAVDWQERADDPVWRVLAGAVRATSATEQIGGPQLRSPGQVLAGLHTAATGGLVAPGQVGRPRVEGEDALEWTELGPAPGVGEMHARLGLVHELVSGVTDGRLPTLLVAAVVHAEIVVARPFVLGNAIVARALERVVIRVGGLDPTGVAVPEVGHADRAGADYRGALTAYASGGSEGVRLWLLHCAEAVERAAAEGVRIADAVRAGRLG